MTTAIRAIVAGVTRLDNDDPVLRYGPALAERLGAALHVVHAFTPPETVTAGAETTAFPPLPGMSSPEIQSGIEQQMERHLQGLPATARVVPHVLAAQAHVALKMVAEEEHADLMLVGPPQQSALERLVVGSTVGRTLRGSRAPTLVLRPPLPEGTARVLLTSDLSDGSAVACRVGIEIARELFADPVFRCLHAVPLLDPPSPGPEPELDVATDTLRLEAFLAKLPISGGSIEPVVRVGVPETTMAAEAAGWEADLVVLGTHARKGLSRLILGSVAEETVRDLTCSTLVVPAHLLET